MKAIANDDADAVERYAVAVATDPSRDFLEVRRAITFLLGLHGLRIAEIAGARWCDLDLRDCRLRVEPVPEGERDARPLKRGDVRYVDLDPGFVQLLLDYRERFDPLDAQWILRSSRTRNDRVCVRQLQREQDKLLSKFALKRAGICTHVARHTYAVRVMERCTELEPGRRLRALQQSLGHASLATTEKYLDGFRVSVTASARVRVRVAGRRPGFHTWRNGDEQSGSDTSQDARARGRSATATGEVEEAAESSPRSARSCWAVLSTESVVIAERSTTKSRKKRGMSCFLQKATLAALSRVFGLFGLAISEAGG